MTPSLKSQIPDYSVLSKTELDANLFKDIHSAYLISLGKVCDNGCADIIDKKLIHVVKVNHLVFSFKINQIDELWYIPLTFPVP